MRDALSARDGSRSFSVFGALPLGVRLVVIGRIQELTQHWIGTQKVQVA